MDNGKKNQDSLFNFVSEIANLARQDAYAAYQTAGNQKYRKVASNITDAVVRSHLSSDPAIACYFVKDDTTSCAVLDFDDHDKSLSWTDLIQAAAPIIAELKSNGIKPFCCRSGGGAGLHIWVFWAEPQKAKIVRQFLRHQLRQCGFNDGTGGVQGKQIEVFPKNDRVKDGGYGNAVALPFARASCPLDKNLLPVDFSDFAPDNLMNFFSPPVAEMFSAPTQNKPVPVKKPELMTEVEVLPGDEEEVRAALKLIQSDDYDDWIRIGMALKNSLGDSSFSLWLEWSQKSAKYEDEAKCLETWDRFEPDGSLGIGTIFYKAQQNGWNGPSNPIIRKMNAKYAIYTHGKTTMIIIKNLDSDDTEVVRFIGKGPFHDRLAAKKVEVEGSDGQPRRIPIVPFWMKHGLAAHIHRVDFDPERPPGTNGTTWNVWTGFAVKPGPGDWGLLKQHILENIANGDEEMFNWLLNWMALGVQKPGLVIGTAPTLKGLPGTGKGVLAHAYGSLWGRHYASITHDAHVKGRFNAHLLGRRFIFVDEGIFGGDRKEAGVLKTRITEPELIFEQKGVDPIKIRNRMIMMVASNEDAVVPADLADRRWQVMEVSDKHREDHAYFGKIARQLDKGGREAFLHDLLARDISIGPDPRRTIKTAALFEQIFRAGGPMMRYVYELLDEGALPQPRAPGNGHGRTTIQALHAELRERYPAGKYTSSTELGRYLKKVFPSIGTTQSGTFQHWGADGVEMRRSTRYSFPPLEIARSMFGTHMGQAVPWTRELTDWHDVREGDGAEDDTPF